MGKVLKVNIRVKKVLYKAGETLPDYILKLYPSFKNLLVSDGKADKKNKSTKGSTETEENS